MKAQRGSGSLPLYEWCSPYCSPKRVPSVEDGFSAPAHTLSVRFRSSGVREFSVAD